MKTNCGFRKTPRRAFTLIEVTMAVGVISVMIVSMLGVMTVGLTTIKDASDDTMHAQILARLASAAQQTPFNQIDGLATSGPLTFDEAGRTTSEHQSSIYRATLEVRNGAADSYPGAPTTASTSVKTVRIVVSTFPPGAKGPLSSSYASLIIPHS